MQKLGRYCRRLDKACGDLNILLAVFAIGLTVLYGASFFTMALVQEAARLKAERMQHIEKPVQPKFQPAAVF